MPLNYNIVQNIFYITMNDRKTIIMLHGIYIYMLLTYKIQKKFKINDFFGLNYFFLFKKLIFLEYKDLNLYCEY